MIGIISYYPREPKLRSIRKRNHVRQLKFITRIFPKEEITIVAQNYDEKDYAVSKNIKYLKYDKPIGVGTARNIILKKFYMSKDECLLLMDDDVVWYDYYDATELVKDFYYHSSKYDFEMLVPLNPRAEPFKKQLYNENLKGYFTLKKISLGVSTCVILLKKVGIYYGEYDKNDEKAVIEDKRFLAEFMLQGLRGYRCLNWVRNNFDTDVCSIIETTDKEASIKWHKMMVSNFEDYIREKYGMSGGSKEFTKRYNKAQANVLVKRDRPYFIQKKLIPKK